MLVPFTAHIKCIHLRINVQNDHVIIRAVDVAMRITPNDVEHLIFSLWGLRFVPVKYNDNSCLLWELLLRYYAPFYVAVKRVMRRVCEDVERRVYEFMCDEAVAFDELKKEMEMT